MLRRWPGAIVTLLAGSLPCAALVVAVTAFYELWSRNATAQVAIKGAVSLTILLASVMVLATRKVESLWVILAAGLLQLTAAAYGLVSKL